MVPQDPINLLFYRFFLLENFEIFSFEIFELNFMIIKAERFSLIVTADCRTPGEDVKNFIEVFEENT